MVWLSYHWSHIFVFLCFWGSTVEFAMYKTVQTSRLYEQIVVQIEESIRKGELKAGDQLPAERELGLQFGVSRTAVREAVKDVDPPLLDRPVQGINSRTTPDLEGVIGRRCRVRGHQKASQSQTCKGFHGVPPAFWPGPPWYRLIGLGGTGPTLALAKVGTRPTHEPGHRG